MFKVGDVIIVKSYSLYATHKNKKYFDYKSINKLHRVMWVLDYGNALKDRWKYQVNSLDNDDYIFVDDDDIELYTINKQHLENILND